MTESSVLVATACTVLVFGPLLAGLLVFLLPGRRLKDAVPITLAVAMLIVLWRLSREVLSIGAVILAPGGHLAPLGIEFRIDGLALAMLWLTGIVALAVNIHAVASLPVGKGSGGTGYRALWLLLWSGLNALFLAADLFNIYVVLEVTSLTAISLVAAGRSPQATTAAARYLFFALAGSMLYLLGVALVYGNTGLLALRLLESPAATGPLLAIAVGLMTFGLAIKGALFPVHAWLPRAHATAPSAASAVLSALVALAGVYLIVRLWLGPLGGHLGAAAAQGMAAIGMAGMVYGSVQALRQSRLKLVIAYSTVAQLGYLLLVLPLGSVLAWQGILYHALSHGLAKAALFLAAGNIIYMLGNDRLESLARPDRVLAGNVMVIGLAGVSLAGLPPSGGFMGKWWLIQAALETGQWWWALAIGAGGLLAAAYVFRVLGHALTEIGPDAHPDATAPARRLPHAMYWPALMLALAAILLGLAGQTLLPFLRIGLPGSIGG